MDHIVKATDEDELGMDYIRTIDGDADNDTLLQRVDQGHFTQWNEMAKVAVDRGKADKYLSLTAEEKVPIDAAIELAVAAKIKPIEGLPIEEEIIK